MDTFEAIRTLLAVRRYSECHQGQNIGGNMFQRFGVFAAGDDEYPGTDQGR